MNAAMNRPFSVYLDLVRFAAAVLVYMWHSNQRFLTADKLPASDYGHSAVIVFFVLSGFVIAFVTDTKENRLAEFAASRISRVYSVAAPTLVITIVLDAIGRSLYPAIYQYPFDQFAVRLLASLLMLNEVWLISITSFSNVPYWSICFEWWNYVTFAMVMFLPARVGWLLVAITALVIGPKVVMLAPIWWMGVALYRWRGLRNLSLPLAWVMASLSIVGLVMFHRYNMMAVAEGWLAALVGPDLTYQLTFAKRVFADYLLGAIVFANFAAVRRIVEVHGGVLMAIAGPVRFVANYTFSLYLLHQPLFLFWAAVVQGDPEGSGYWWSVTALTTLSVGVIGFFTETRRHGLRTRILPMLDRWEKAWALPARSTRSC